MSVGRICVREVDLADADESVQVAAGRMRDRKVGSLVVCDAAKHPVGVLTDRDLAIRVVAAGRDPGATAVEEVMTRSPHCLREESPIEEALRLMRTVPCRRLPVVDAAEELAGVVSLDDVLSLLAEEFRDVGTILNREDPGSLAMV